MNRYSLKDSLERIDSYWCQRRGYEPWKPAGLCPDIPMFRNTFNPSATHTQIFNILSGREPLRHSSYYVVETVYRHPDIGAVGDPSHLSLFRMLGVVQFTPPDLTREGFAQRRANFIAEVLDFVATFGLEPSLLVATYFRGGSFSGVDLPADEDLRDLLSSQGLPKDNLVGMGGTFSFLLNPQEEVGIAGWRSDLYLAAPGAPLLEIATLDFSEFLSRQGSATIQKNDRFKLLGFYAGVERLLSTRAGGDIWNVAGFSQLLEYCFTYLGEKHGYSNGTYLSQIMGRDAKIFIDRLRAIVHITDAGQLPNNSSRGQMLKRLIQDVIRFFHCYLGTVDTKFMSDVLSRICCLDSLDASLIPKVSHFVAKMSRRG